MAEMVVFSVEVSPEGPEKNCYITDLCKGGKSSANSQKLCRPSQACIRTLSSFSAASLQRQLTAFWARDERVPSSDSFWSMILAAWIASSRSNDPISPRLSVV